MNVRSVDECVKGVKCEVSVGVGISVCWCVDGGVGDGNGSDDGIKFGIVDGYDLRVFDWFFDVYSVEKPLIRYFYEIIE